MHDIYSFGEWMQARRNQLGLSRAGLARLIHCSPVTIKKIERDERRPSVQIAQLLAVQLKIPVREQEDFIRRARGEFVASFSSPVEMSLAEARSSTTSNEELKHNLPVQTTPFFGRESEIREIETALANPSCRLLTILGAGGMGKTRLSIATATKLTADFTDGVIFISLVAIEMSTDVSLVNPLVTAIADEFKMSFYGDETPERQVINYLQRKEVLLILDNFEHLLNTAPFISEILQNAPDVKIIVTSRERLNLQEEWLVPLQGLDFPEQETESNLLSYSAVELFVQRAKQIKGDFDPNVEDDALRKICKLVEGMPLGIELAAGWVTQLSGQEIVAEIEREIDFLSSDLRNIPARHRSMRAVFTYSWQRLSGDEKQVLKKLSVFRDGFQREAALEIADATLKVLADLVDKSIIRRNRAGRYEIHELMRQFAAEKLGQDPDLESDTRSKHGHYYLQFLAQKQQALHRENSHQVVPALLQDSDNIRFAWRWGVANLAVERLRDALYMLITFYDAHGWYLEIEETFSQAFEAINVTLSRENEAIPDDERSELFIISQVFKALSGFAQFRMGRLERGMTIMENSVSMITPTTLAERWLEALTRLTLSIALLWRGEFARVNEISRTVVNVCAAYGDQHNQSLSLYVSGLATNLAGNYEAAKRLAQNSHQIALEMGSEFMIFYSLRVLGNIATAQGDYFQAEQYLQQSVEISWAHGFYGQSMHFLNELGDVLRLQNKFEEANKCYERSYHISSEMNSVLAIANTYWGLGNLNLQQNKFDDAKAYFSKSRETGATHNWTTPGGPGWVSLAVGNVQEANQIFLNELGPILQLKQAPRALDILAGLAHVLANTNQPEQAIELIALILSHPATTYESEERVQRLIDDLVTELQPSLVAAAQSSGQKLELWQTVKDLIDAP